MTEEKSTEYFLLPKDIHEKISEKIPMFSYSLNPEQDQMIWVQFNFDAFDLALTIDCNEKRHSMKFIVIEKSEP